MGAVWHAARAAAATHAKAMLRARASALPELPFMVISPFE
jgi:hypothetical protein